MSNNYELCDGIDNNCDGTIDIDAEDRFLIFTDEDEDGFGDENAVGTLNCELLDGFSLNNDDCDDGNGAISPDADDEICDGEDNDCDELQDEHDAIDAFVWFVDEDDDGYGVPEDTIVSCQQPDGYVLDFTDCDDTDSSIYLGASKFWTMELIKIVMESI